MSIRASILDTLSVEIAALEALRASLTGAAAASVEECIKTVFEHTTKERGGRLIVTGIGKSAIVAQKIVATLNSTGTPAVFMHAADAIHGDLGIIQPPDLVLCLSKSGETPEIRTLAPLVKNLGNVLIAMVANPNATLAKYADFVLLTPIAREADPNNLAPTASTTAQMATGDALAMALLALRGFSAADFARVHPGGALGKQLYLRVRDLAAMHPSPAVRENASIAQIIDEMTTKRLGATAVTTESGELVGIITDGDLRRMLQPATPAADWHNLTAADLASTNPKRILETELAVRALEMMRHHQITQLVVMTEAHTYAGMVHLHDLLREGLI